MLKGRSGVTLVEVLVASAILAILVGLAVPAVQRARASSVRARCSNNLHQLAIAFQNYHAAHNRLPSGVGATGPTDPYPYMNWHAQLLPYLEQSALWDLTVASYRADKHFTNNPPHSGRGVVVEVLTCPADSRVSSPLRSGYAATSYLGVTGRNAARQDGVLYLGSNHRFGDIADGTANTLLVGERPPSTDQRYGWWYAGWGQNHDGECDGVLGVRTEPQPGLDYSCPGSPELFQPGRFDNQCDAFHFWSPHSGGANFLFADGSVRFLRYEADPLLPALATRAGGEPVTAPD